MAAADPNDVVYCFLAEYYDDQACFFRHYNVLFYTKDQCISMVDLKSNKIFLAKTKEPGVHLKDLYIGAIVTIKGRQLEIKDFGNAFTRKVLAPLKKGCTAVVKPSQWGSLGKSLVALSEKGFTFGRCKSVRLTKAQAAARGDDELAAGPSMAVEVLGPGCEEAVAEVLGYKAREGDTEFFFKTPLSSSASFTDCSVCIIKPHILLEGGEAHLLEILQREGLDVTAVQRFHFDRKAARQFMDPYFGVLPHANHLVEELQSGPCLGVEVSGQDVHNRLRGLCGPDDPEIARYLRSHTIRANYGKDVVRNAVHCTDLVGDGPLESSFLFDTLQESELIKSGAY